MVSYSSWDWKNSFIKDVRPARPTKLQRVVTQTGLDEGLFAVCFVLFFLNTKLDEYRRGVGPGKSWGMR